jgi:hypothetical protein
MVAFEALSSSSSPAAAAAVRSQSPSSQQTESNTDCHLLTPFSVFLTHSPRFLASVSNAPRLCTAPAAHNQAGHSHPGATTAVHHAPLLSRVTQAIVLLIASAVFLSGRQELPVDQPPPPANQQLALNLDDVIRSLIQPYYQDLNTYPFFLTFSAASIFPAMPRP